MDELGDQVACIITEPVAGNMNCIPSVDGFLEGMRELCTRHGAVLIFDEVMTGFRFGTGGVQGFVGVTPDLTCLGKVIGGGMPVGAFGGRRDIMEHISPLGPVYQAGTLSGNPVAMAAGLATMSIISEPGFLRRVVPTHGRSVCGHARGRRERRGAVYHESSGSMFGGFFTEEESVTQYHQVINSNVSAFNQFFHLMLDSGVYLAPASFEAGFMSAAHTDEDIAATVEAARAAFAAL